MKKITLLIISFILLFGLKKSEAKSLMFKEKEIENYKKIKKYKDHICLEGVCILGKDNWMVYINNNIYMQQNDKIKNIIKDRFVITNVKKSVIEFFDQENNTKFTLKVGEDYKIN